MQTPNSIQSNSQSVDVSIIIPIWNSEHVIERCLNAVGQSSGSICLEVIVVDNGSTDKSQVIVRKGFPRVMIIQNIINRGFAYAVNQGIRASRSQFVLLLNSDALVESNTIFEMYKFMLQYPDAGACGCALFEIDGSVSPSARSFPSLWNTFCEASYLYKILPKTHFWGSSYLTYLARDKIAKVDYIPGTVMMIRRKVFESVGLFDESYFIYYEDSDWGYRAHQAGWSCYYYPFVRSFHLGGTTAKKEGSLMAKESMRSLFYYFYKHRGGKAELYARILWSLGCVMRIMGWSFLSLSGEKQFAHNTTIHKWFCSLKECFSIVDRNYGSTEALIKLSD